MGGPGLGAPKPGAHFSALHEFALGGFGVEGSDLQTKDSSVALMLGRFQGLSRCQGWFG